MISIQASELLVLKDKVEQAKTEKKLEPRMVRLIARLIDYGDFGMAESI